MSAKFTRGPYDKEGNFVFKLVDNPNPKPGLPNRINRWMAAVSDCNGFAVSDEELEAVATLFQASPLLYEALEECRKELEQLQRLSHGKKQFPDTKGMEMADNALRAARGEG